MTIENTEWADYDNRQTFDYILDQLAPYGFTDESWGNDACPKITLLGDAYHEHDINLFVGWKDGGTNLVHLGIQGRYTLSMDSNFQRSLGENPDTPFYSGDDVEELLRVAKMIKPAQDTYRVLLQRGYEVTDTGGGCKAWIKSFGRHYVMVTDDGGGDCSFITTFEGINGKPSLSVDGLVSVGVYDSGSPIADDPNSESDADFFVVMGEPELLNHRLEKAEALAISEEEKTKSE